MKKKFCGFLTAIIIGMIVSGCAEKTIVPETTSQNSQEEVKLNERQVSILKETGLPESYHKLTIKQKNSITAIEDMLENIESKYQKKFVYLSYVMQNQEGKEELQCYEESMKSYEVVTVTRNYTGGAGKIDPSKYVYEDNYDVLQLKGAYQNALADIVLKHYSGDIIKVYSALSRKKDGATIENVLTFVSAHSEVFVDSSDCSEEELTRLAEAVKSILQEGFSGMSAKVTFYRLDHAGMEEVNAYNIDRILKEHDYQKALCEIDTSGNAVVE